MTNEEQLELIRTECGLDTLEEAADYALLYYTCFKKDFIDYCEKQIKTEYRITLDEKESKDD